MRLFTAISLPNKVRNSLKEIIKPLDGIRWQNHEQFHLTLRFIGEVDREVKELLIEKLGKINLPQFNIDIRSTGYFPARGHPRVIWAGVEKSEMLLKLQKRVEEQCQQAGLESEKRPYHPHITLGKVKNGSKKSIEYFIKSTQLFAVEKIPVTSFELFSSNLTAEGAIHKQEKKFRFAS